jgi:hypothetical protein
MKHGVHEDIVWIQQRKDAKSLRIVKSDGARTHGKTMRYHGKGACAFITCPPWASMLAISFDAASGAIVEVVGGKVTVPVGCRVTVMVAIFIEVLDEAWVMETETCDDAGDDDVKWVEEETTLDDGFGMSETPHAERTESTTALLVHAMTCVPWDSKLTWINGMTYSA